MNKEKREEMKAKYEAATPGPWVYAQLTPYAHAVQMGGEDTVIADCYNPESTDAEFIIYAHENILELLSAYDDLEADRDRWKERAEAVK